MLCAFSIRLCPAFHTSLSSVRYNKNAFLLSSSIVYYKLQANISFFFSSLLVYRSIYLQYRKSQTMMVHRENVLNFIPTFYEIGWNEFMVINHAIWMHMHMHR